MTVKRRGGVLPLGEGRIGVPLDDMPPRAWANALREAMASERLEDPRWQHAAAAVTVDAVDGVPHLVFPTMEIDDADFLVRYMAAIDSAIAAANSSSD